MHLDDGRALTFYRLRLDDGTADAHSRGLLIDAKGKAELLRATDVDMTPRRWWRSPRTGARYPVDWQVRVPGHGLAIELKALVDPQEWTGDLRYWEGAVDVTGTGGRAAPGGRGYLELTGYAP